MPGRISEQDEWGFTFEFCVLIQKLADWGCLWLAVVLQSKIQVVAAQILEHVVECLEVLSSWKKVELFKLGDWKVKEESHAHQVD